MITFALEPVSQCWDEVMVLATQHWSSTQTYRRHEPFCPSRERYEACNTGDYYSLFTARDHGKLVGYFGIYLSPSMHSQLLTATEDTLYLAPSHRNGRNAIRFIQYIEAFCKLRRTHELLFSCEMDNASGIHGLLKMLGYQAVIQQYSKLLDIPEQRVQNSNVPHLLLGSDTAITETVMEAVDVGRT